MAGCVRPGFFLFFFAGSASFLSLPPLGGGEYPPFSPMERICQMRGRRHPSGSLFVPLFWVPPNGSRPLPPFLLSPDDGCGAGECLYRGSARIGTRADDSGLVPSPLRHGGSSPVSVSPLPPALAWNFRAIERQCTPPPFGRRERLVRLRLLAASSTLPFFEMDRSTPPNGKSSFLSITRCQWRKATQHSNAATHLINRNLLVSPF